LLAFGDLSPYEELLLLILLYSLPVQNFATFEKNSFSSSKLTKKPLETYLIFSKYQPPAFGLFVRA
jgi:hypothetical protein